MNHIHIPRLVSQVEQNKCCEARGTTSYEGSVRLMTIQESRCHDSQDVDTNVEESHEESEALEEVACKHDSNGSRILSGDDFKNVESDNADQHL